MTTSSWSKVGALLVVSVQGRFDHNCPADSQLLLLQMRQVLQQMMLYKTSRNVFKHLCPSLCVEQLFWNVHNHFELCVSPSPLQFPDCAAKMLQMKKVVCPALELCVVMRHWRSFLLLLFHHRTTTTVELINTTAVSMQLKDTLKWSNADAPTYFTTFIWRSISTSADILAIAKHIFSFDRKKKAFCGHDIQFRASTPSFSVGMQTVKCNIGHNSPTRRRRRARRTRRRRRWRANGEH